MGRNGFCGELARHILYGALIVRKVKLTGHETTLSAHCGNDECVFPSNRTIRPALGDCLDLRPELHAFHAVLVGVAKCRTLPATKGMVSDWNRDRHVDADHRSEEHTSELQSLMRISYAVFCLKKKKTPQINHKYLSTKRTTK